jgi:hypothetical protein
MQDESSIFKKTQAFSIPKGYFEGLSSKILSRIDQKSIDLENLERANIFKVPDNYFQHLELITNIERFDKSTIFNVPQSYFETLPIRILSKIDSNEKVGKVIKVNWFSTKTARWSAAASIVLMIGLWFAIPAFTKDKTALALEKISKEDIKTYLETQDLSYLEYESTTENTNNLSSDNKVLEGLKINKQAILEHLENQDLDEEI